MKVLLILVVLLLGLWLWRSNRQIKPKPGPAPDRAASKPAAMVRCSVCALHIPVADALEGKLGSYCSVDHLHRAER